MDVPCLQSIAGVIDKLVIERLLKSMVLIDLAAPSHTARHRRIVEYCRQINPPGLPMINRVSACRACRFDRSFRPLWRYPFVP